MRFDYPKNVHFSCTKCGLCCGDTAKKKRHILLLEKEAELLKAHTKQEISAFADKIPEKVPYVFEMHKTSGKCVFLKNNQCTIYEVRPLICRFYPFEMSTDKNGVYKFRATDECPAVSCNNADGEENLDAQFFRELLDLACIELNSRST